MTNKRNNKNETVISLLKMGLIRVNAHRNYSS